MFLVTSFRTNLLYAMTKITNVQQENKSINGKKFFQKDDSQIGGDKKAKHTIFFKKSVSLPPGTHTFSVLRFALFALLPTNYCNNISNIDVISNAV